MFQPQFPITRLRRLRYNSTIRELVAETRISTKDLVMPLFVTFGGKVKQEIQSMPGQYRLSVDELVLKCKSLWQKNIKAVLLFGIPEEKDEHGHVGATEHGIVQEALRAVKKEIPILAYSAKFASAFYWPFRDAAGSAPAFGDRRSYQMDFRNGNEALREMEHEIAEGADMIMVKPDLAYLDVVAQTKVHFNIPLAVYNVSGEYAMVKAAAQNGWIDETRVVMESMHAFKRAGADLILTYWAELVADVLNREK